MPGDKPLLLFPIAAAIDRDDLSGGARKIHVPTHVRQRRRLSPMFRHLQQAFNARRAELQRSSSGIIPEQVLVLETAGEVEDFIVAVRRIRGMEWLGEFTEDEIPPDDDFFRDEEHRENTISGRLYLVMANQQAIQELLSLWNNYKRNENYKFSYGQTKWRKLFQQLKNIRPWGFRDRIYETGVFEYWQSNAQQAQQNVRFEAELWFRNRSEDRIRIQTDYNNVIQSEGGRLVSNIIIPEIAYHAILAEVPICSVQNIIEGNYTELVRYDHVMFFRPVGQMSVELPNYDSLEEISEIPEGPLRSDEPVVAILDGFPLANHNLLQDRLIVDDCDDWANECPAAERCHGTAMASLIIYGELDGNHEPLSRPVYIRPIMKPTQLFPDDPRVENIPDDVLSVDLVHRAVRRIFEGEGEERAEAPTVRIINISIADSLCHFDNAMSSLARLLDWLSLKYNVLFVVSAGNHPQDITLDVPRVELNRELPQEIEAVTLKAIANDIRNRRILSPGESINSLTIGARHNDLSNLLPTDRRINPYQNTSLPSPICAIGSGYRRSIKPDIFLDGGRQCFDEIFQSNDSKTMLTVNNAGISPGQKVAYPSREGEVNRTCYSRGTSNAAALATRLGAQLFEVLDELKEEPNGNIIQDRFISVLIKTMLVHGASWGDAYDAIERILKTPEHDLKEFREQSSRFLGYGSVRSSRLFSCTDQRATILGCGELSNGRAHLYVIPLPPSLASATHQRRLTATLAWISPIAPKTRKYRKAALWFSTPMCDLDFGRQDAPWQSARRGTVQHEIFVGDRASAFAEGEAITIKVNCKEDAASLSESIPYGIAVSFEVAEGIEIPIYEEIRTRIRPPIRIQPIPTTNE